MISKKTIAGALAALALAAPLTATAASARGWGWGGPLPWIGAGVVAGAIIADQSYRPRPGYYYDSYAYDGPYYRPANYGGDPRRLCAENFRSFDWNSGYYTTYGGERRLCPYLR